MIEIKKLDKNSLANFIASVEFSQMPVIPISRHRAISQLHNPVANDNDILLLLAYLENEMVGYLGVLPDNMRCDNGTDVHCGWMSCIWVSPNHRGMGIAQKLLQVCFESWSDKLICTEFTEPAKHLYQRTGKFQHFTTLKGIRLYYRSDLQTILPHKHNFLKKLKPILQLADVGINFLGDIRFNFYRQKEFTYTLQFLAEVDEESAAFIAEHNVEENFKRDKTALNWMLQYPWVIPHYPKDKDSLRYHFSATDKWFDFTVVKVVDRNNRMVAFLLFAQRNKSLKIPYCYFRCSVQQIADIIQTYVIRNKICTMTVYNASVSNYMRANNMHALYKRNNTREYLISKYLANSVSLSVVHLQDGDGDCAFT